MLQCPDISSSNVMFCLRFTTSILSRDDITLKKCEVHPQSQHMHLQHQHINESQESGHIFQQCYVVLEFITRHLEYRKPTTPSRSHPPHACTSYSCILGTEWVSWAHFIISPHSPGLSHKEPTEPRQPTVNPKPGRAGKTTSRHRSSKICGSVRRPS